MNRYPDLPQAPEAIEERKRSIVQLIANGVARNQTRACMSLGINPRTLTHWKQQDPEFAAALQWAMRQKMQDDIEMVEAKVLEEALDGNMAAAKWFLQHNAEEYREPPKEQPAGHEPIEAGWRETNKPQRIGELPMGTAPVDSASIESMTLRGGDATWNDQADGLGETSSTSRPSTMES